MIVTIYLIVMIDRLLQSQFMEKGFKKAENVVLLLFLLTLKDSNKGQKGTTV